ncbi:helix-turn-helix domain-containing protein [Nocardia sp. NPDC058379]|uniref:helix-turn-helix domain-containing protein n=1 Tax=unclassified Nocardia TaxID=2637762 RepID=UPI0036549228
MTRAPAGQAPLREAEARSYARRVRPIMSDHELDGGWELVRAASPVWKGLSLSGFRDGGGGGPDLRIVALPAVTVVVQIGESGFTTADARGVDGLVAGIAPGTHQVRSDRVDCVELRMPPTLAYSLLGIAPPDITGTVLGIEDLWGSSVDRLRAQLAETSTWPARFELTTRFLADHATARHPDAEVAATWQRIVAHGGRVRVRELVDLTGWSQKRLWTRFTAQIGVTPKRAAMVVRFRRAFDQLVAGESAAAAAAACGYTDQSHLHRDIAMFAGTTPGALAPR